MISNYFNKYSEKTCVIIGNGPSLNHVPSMWLDKYVTFGSNRIYLKYSPTFYVCTNPLVIKQNIEDIKLLRSIKFIRDGFDIGIGLRINPVRKFSFNPHISIYEGYTVTFVSLQLAYYMGFTTILLVGVDHRYKYDGKPNEEKILEGDDPNHFDANYFKGQKWNNPDLEKSEVSYNLAKVAYQDDHRRIVNLTPDTALDVFEKDSIENW